MRIAASALIAIVSACMLAACASSGAAPRAVRSQQNMAVALAFLDTVFNKHEVEQAFRLYVGPVYRQHNPGIADGAAAAVQALAKLTHDYPQLHQQIKRTVAQGDLVAVHSRYLAGPADRAGEPDKAAVDIFRLEHGKIVEHWDVVQDVPENSANDNSMF